MKVKIFGKVIWGTDWSLKGFFPCREEAQKFAHLRATESGVAHSIEDSLQRPGQFEVWREIPPLEWRKTNFAREHGM